MTEQSKPVPAAFHNLCDGLRKKISQLIREDAWEKILEALQQSYEIAGGSAGLADLQLQLAARDQEIARLKDTAGQAGEVSVNGDQVKILEDKVSRLSVVIADQMGLLKSKQETIETLQGKLEGLADLENKHDQNNTAVKTMQDTIKSSAQKVADLQVKLKGMESENSTLKEKLETALTDLTEAKAKTAKK